MFSETWVLSFVGLILSVCALQVAALHHSSWSNPSSKWRDSLPLLHKLSSPLHLLSFVFFLCHLSFLFLYSHIFLLISVSTLSSSSCVHLFLQAIIIFFTIVVFSFLPFRSELSHLLNHLVKSVSSGNFLWVSHHNCYSKKS